ncbi:MAG: PKD domain-containing protein, partial [Bacteroidales bacterium]|nr:PKD domain-containing protein [Bacteroidales bacterium]
MKRICLKSLFMGKATLLVILLFVSISNINAQESQGGTPPSFEEGRSINAVDNYSVDELTIYPPDVQTLRLEDKNRGKNGLPPRVGINVPVNAGLNTAGSWTTRPDGSKVWILKISSDGALAMNLIFDDFYLAPGTKMFMYNESKKQVLGAFTYKNNSEHGRFTTTQIQGETVYIEYYEPAKVVDESRFNIQDAGYFYNMDKQLARLTETYGDQNNEKTVGASDGCEVNINCSPVGDDWQDEKRGVAQITFLAGGAWYLCTGTLVNNTSYDETPYFLTAFHCGAADATDTELLSWEFHFNYESPDCTDPGTEPATDVIIGATRIAEGNINGGSDFFLLQLEATPDGTFNPYYNGWDNSGTASATGAGIHHPAGDIKKISTYGSIAQSGSNNIGGDVMAANSTWSVTWAENLNGWGVTEGGSSGSPLFRDNGLIIGTLTGGASFCTAQTASDVYGRVEYHWNSNGATDADQLEPWLDPTNSGATTLLGYDPFATAPPTVDFYADRYNILEGDAVNFFDLSSSPSGPITGWSWTFDSGNPATSTNQNPTNITYNTTGKYDVSLSATNSNGTNSQTYTEMINVIDPSATSCDTLAQWCCNPSIYTSAEGYIAGTNEYECLEVAEFFQNPYPYNTVTGARFYFSQVTSGTNPDITFKVYADDTGDPGTLLKQTNVSLDVIEAAYNADGYYDLVLGESIAYPESGFYIGFTIPQSQTSGDTIAFVTNDDADSDANTGYCLYPTGWETYSAWGMSLQNLVFANVCHDVNLAPVADFEGTPQLVNAGNTVAFTDISFGGTPTSWSWTFAGGTPNSSTDPNPVITYNTPGIYAVSLTVANANGSDDITKNGYISVVDPNTCACDQLGHVVGGEMLYTVAVGEYLAGTNNYGDLAKVEYFDDYGTADNLEGAYFSFGAADVTNAGTNVTFNVWAADGGASVGGTYAFSPGTIIASTTVPITTIENDVANGDSTYVAFDPPIAITGDFFLGFEIPSPATLDDAIGLRTGETDSGADTGWEQWSDNDWYSMVEAGWGGTFNMAIYPVVCTEGAPLPEFGADNKTIMAGGTVNFIDMTTCGPTGWDWSFPGGTPTSSTNQNPSVIYNTAGTYDVGLTSSNAQGSNPAYKANYINVLQPIVWWDFPGNPDNALSDGGIPANDGTKSISVVGGVNAPTFPLYAEASGWDAGAGTKAWVVEFETTGYVNLKLSSKQSGANLSPQDFKVQYSLDNAAWTDLTGAAVTVAEDWTTGVLNDIELPAVCENQANVYLRWIMTSNTGVGGNLNANRGSYIDDIYVIGELSTIPPVADFTADQTTVCEGGTVQFSDNSTDSPTSWDWSFSGGTPATSTDQNPSVVYSSAGTYDVSLTVTNSAGNDTKTVTGYITVNPNVAASVSITADQNDVCAGTNITFTATPTNGGIPTYQWKVNGVSVGASSPTYSSSTLTDGDAVTVEMTSSVTCVTGSPATSNAVNMVINPILPASVSIAADDNNICDGTNVTFIATPTNGGTPTYEWFLNGTPVGANSPTYSNNALNNGDAVTCEMTSSEVCVSGNPATSNAVNMTVNPILPVSISITADQNDVCDGTNITFTATPTNGGTPTYEWFLDGTPVGANSPTYSSNALNNGDAVTCEMTSSEVCVSGNPATSNAVNMIINPNLPASVSITADQNDVCDGTNVTFTAIPTNGGIPTYQWKVNGVSVGANSPTYSSSTLTDGDAVTVEMTSSETCVTGSPATSNAVNMVINPILPVSVTIAEDQNNICDGTNVTFTA